MTSQLKQDIERRLDEERKKMDKVLEHRWSSIGAATARASTTPAPKAAPAPSRRILVQGR
jgi:hypothetical protein